MFDLRLLRCRPPNYIQYAPRSLDEYKNWRSHEFMNFILFFAVPVFNDVMMEDYFNHLLLLVISLQHLLQKKIDRKDLNKIDRMLHSFVNQLETLYDEHIMLSGVHELLHLVEITKTIGLYF